MGSLHLGLASFSCCARTPDLPLIVNFAFALRYFFPRYSVAEGGPLNLPQSMIIKLGLLNFLILFERQHRIIICSRPRPLQHTSPQYVGLTFHLTNTPQLQTRSSTLPKKLRSCAMPFVFSCQFPCHASFRPRPLGLKYTPTPLCACIFFFFMWSPLPSQGAELFPSAAVKISLPVVPRREFLWPWDGHHLCGYFVHIAST